MPDDTTLAQTFEFLAKINDFPTRSSIHAVTLHADIMERILGGFTDVLHRELHEYGIITVNIDGRIRASSILHHVTPTWCVKCKDFEATEPGTLCLRCAEDPSP